MQKIIREIEVQGIWEEMYNPNYKTKREEKRIATSAARRGKRATRS